MKRPLFLILLGLLSLALQGPVLADTMEGGKQSCGLELTPTDLAAYQANLAAGAYEFDASRTQATYNVNLFFHVVRNTNGTGGIPQSQLDQAMLDLADAYAGMGICFIVFDQDTINSSTYYNIDSDAERSALKGINNHSHAIDCYFVNDDDGWCGMSSFTWSSDQGITFSNSCVGLASNPSTFPHEIGHYFDLLHTHETANGAECPNGANCGTAGDGLCDTPADPGLGTDNVSASCVYTGSETIFCSGLTRSYNPDPDNIMSYSRKTCRDTFTANQRSRILATLTGGRWGESAFNAADFDAPTPAGWSNATVPRNTTGASSAACLVTATLPGNSNSTYLNAATRQANSGATFPFIRNRILIDNSAAWNYGYSWGINWVGSLYYNNFGPFNVRGGRHALTASLDRNDEVCETNENDNLDNSQWIWSPYVLSPGASVNREDPPDRMGATFTYPNCDGFLFTGSSWWSVVAIQPTSSTADYDLNLHQGYANSTTGFSTTLATSSYGSGNPDWVIVNHNVAGSGGTYEAGLVDYDGETADVRVNRVNSRTVTKVDGTRVCGEIAANQILDVFEFHVNSGDLGLSWNLHLTSEQTADLDLYLYAKTLEYGSRGSYLDLSATLGSSDETISESFTETGYYALVVAKHGSVDLGSACAYDLKFSVSATKLSIYPPVTPTVALVQDADPYGNPEWRDQLDAQGIAYSILPTAALATTDLSPYGLVIVPSPATATPYANVMAGLANLDEYNLSGGVLVLSSCISSTGGDGDAIWDGISQTHESCMVVHPTSHLLVTGVAADAPGNSAVRYVYNNVPGGYTTLAYSDCGSGQPTMLLNESRGLLLYGSPIEHSQLNYNCTLGESIENIVAWAWKRTRQTVRASGTPLSPAVTRQLVYRNGNFFGSATHATSESQPWLSMTPTSGLLGNFGTVTTNWIFVPSSQTAGHYSGTATVTHSLYNTPETVYTYLTVNSRKPVAPLVVSFTPVDFTAGQAIMNLSFNPVTLATDGQPVTVDHYNLYYDDDWTLALPAVTTLFSTSANLYFHFVGMSEMAFVRVTAVDSNGLLLADSEPGKPLQDVSTLSQAPANFVQLPTASVVQPRD